MKKRIVSIALMFVSFVAAAQSDGAKGVLPNGRVFANDDIHQMFSEGGDRAILAVYYCAGLWYFYSTIKMAPAERMKSTGSFKDILFSATKNDDQKIIITKSIITYALSFHDFHNSSERGKKWADDQLSACEDYVGKISLKEDRK